MRALVKILRANRAKVKFCEKLKILIISQGFGQNTREIIP